MQAKYTDRVYRSHRAALTLRDDDDGDDDDDDDGDDDDYDDD